MSAMPGSRSSIAAMRAARSASRWAVWRGSSKIAALETTMAETNATRNATPRILTGSSLSRARKRQNGARRSSMALPPAPKMCGHHQVIEHGREQTGQQRRKDQRLERGRLRAEATEDPGQVASQGAVQNPARIGHGRGGGLADDKDQRCS